MKHKKKKKDTKIKVIFKTYFKKIFNYERITHLPVAALGIDFVHGDSLSLLQEFGFPADKYLAAGIIDGRNVWRRSEEHTSELQSRGHLVCRLLLEKNKIAIDLT